MVITIDGPSASGKSTAAQELAKELGFYYLNSGYLYRALAYVLITRESYTFEELAHPHPEDLERYLNEEGFSYEYDDGRASIIFEGQDITAHLKTPDVDQGASILSLNEEVRDVLMQVQRRIAQKHDIIVEGRDTGSVVFPSADYKFFLTASMQERASRWQHMQAMRGISYTTEQSLEALDERDTRDKERAIAPLHVPHDAFIIDSTDLTSNQVVQEMMKHICV